MGEDVHEIRSELTRTLLLSEYDPGGLFEILLMQAVESIEELVTYGS